MSAEPDDLLGKADALMARQHAGRGPAAPYPEIPVLEEVVDPLSAGGDLPLLTEYLAPAPLDEEQAQALAESIRAALLLELQPRIDALIDARLTEDLKPLVERVFDELRGNLQLIARDVIGDAIHSAVEKELERRRSGG
jgi:hypothetical protein